MANTARFPAPSAPSIRLCLGVTGHRDANPAFSVNRGAIEEALAEVFDLFDLVVAAERAANPTKAVAETRMHSLLVDGLDQIAARQAKGRKWELVAPLPFGRRLNTAINAHPLNADEARFLLSGNGVCSAATQERATVIDDLVDSARLFELADRDALIEHLYLAKLSAPTDVNAAQAYSFAASERVALAAQVMIEQSDIVVGVWDGGSTSFVGGTGHTIALALSMGTPVLWIDARNPRNWHILQVPEHLAALPHVVGEASQPMAELRALVETVLRPTPGKTMAHKGDHEEGLKALDAEKWRPKSQFIWHGYRRVEALFGSERMRDRFRNLTIHYESPDAILTGSGQSQIEAARNLLQQDPGFVTRISTDILKRLAWADGISSHLSDAYRGGMVLNFLFGAFAVVGGIAYLPIASSEQKWIFAGFELVLLAGILAITWVGQKRRWHRRWFETRRVAEYLRHATILLTLGVARPSGRWPRGTQTSWPEWYVRHGLRDVGLPRVTITSAYLRTALSDLVLRHVAAQSAYHRQKAKRLHKTHHRLDQLSEALFTLAVLSVSLYLGLKLAGSTHVIDKEVASHFSKLFTFLGVFLPTFGGAIASIRYFGDFERFSAISEVTAEKLDVIAERGALLLAGPDDLISYAHVAELAHATDDVVVNEIENWQSVFGGKNITVPV
ncbi:hypothetical protein [Aquidulcibacter sp.]|uniref:hypothetical protein n=1 Tax=Aquidulcibacter sp. TaxID=2052990 RepID=UPI0025C3208A|nr:hypothetical protein [Aquidulcibacter sp.]MCA3692232.1 hypothetical protein [Aquidulcibacter sp.]